MRRNLLYLLALIAMLLHALNSMAQEQLAIGELFESKEIREAHGVREVFLTGKNVKEYGFSLFRSLMVDGNRELSLRMRSAAEVDSKLSVDLKRLLKGDNLIGLYMQMPPKEQGLEPRFILYRQKDDDGAMVIYIEGNTTLDNIIKVQYK